MTAAALSPTGLLFGGAIRYLDQAARALGAGSWGEAHTLLRRAEAIVRELDGTLDPELGDVAPRLHAIYAGATRSLRHACFRQNAAGASSVAGDVRALRSLWREATGLA
jgi:flagellar biosynthetic protein FliS